ncbi:MAG: heavy metal translocating P-type ATPase metal-binding domain-containing protein [Flavobacteriaceae bacterium]|nr:heavy metal translocating P-type ATPase metal-binding domain-containing protein [Flavobacteriaceae bacterium]
MEKEYCYHCGDMNAIYIQFDEKVFCCNGCKTVYEILNQSALTKYYDIEKSPGIAPEALQGKYDYLENKEIISSLIEFDDETIQIVNLYVPHIHCSSCIWVLENLNKLNVKIVTTQVNFPKKTVRITYNLATISLKQVVELLCSIGYEPYISLDDSKKKNHKIDHSLLFKLVTAGFAFGNVMFLSFPEYFELNEFWLNQYKLFFHQIMLVFSLPVVFYAAQDYFISAYKGLKHKILNIDVPIALGILVLFIRSTYDITTHTGQGFLDSLCGLVFFLLLGKFFQQKTYSFLSFERDYKSYFPIAVTKINGEEESAIPVQEIKKGDRLLVRNEELIPVDAILIKGEARIDYSFVTGEEKPIKKTYGDKLFAGGKQTEGILEVEATKSISQSYLTQLWDNDVFKINKQDKLETITDSISKYFTVIILAITFITALYWFVVDSTVVINAVSAVLIVACPCALALSAPFTLGNVLRILGKHKLYLKNTEVIESLSKITTVVFDKTGTLTQSQESDILYEGVELFEEDLVAIKSVLRASNHPLSRMLYEHLGPKDILDVANFTETMGKGITGTVNEKILKIGSAPFVGLVDGITSETNVYVNKDAIILGKYTFKNKYRSGVLPIFEKLNKKYKLVVLSGDNEGEKKYLEKTLPKETQLLFQQKPEDKLHFIKELQEKGEQVLMVGDGLNDSGALAQSNVGIVIAENVNVFSPACDAIIDATKFEKIPSLLSIGTQARQLIIASFVLSFLYNIVGLSYAVTGNLSPIIAAILMPLSSISVVTFVTIWSNIMVKKSKLNSSSI